MAVVISGLCILTLMPILCYSYDSSLQLNHRCKARCDSHRTFGWRGEYQLDCKREYPDEWKKYCIDDCTHCPDSICVSSKPNIFKCPSTDIEGQCKQRCDSNRKKGSLDGYILKCDEVYSSSKDIEDCKSECGVCPKWVCDPGVSSNVYYCPTGNYDTDCKKLCETQRRDNFGGTWDKFSFKCTDYISDINDIRKCQDTCSKCPLMICNENDSDDEFTCPSRTDPKPLPTTTKAPPPKKYEGRCKQFCERFRHGGLEKYSFNCRSGDVFVTTREMEDCIDDCAQCPEDVCSSTRNQFNCPASDLYIDYTLAFGICMMLSVLLLIGVIAVGIVISCRKNAGVYATTTAVIAPVSSMQVQPSTYQVAYQQPQPQQQLQTAPAITS